MIEEIAILTADWHLRDDKPRYRTDDYYSTQMGKLKQVMSYSIGNRIPIYSAGDIFNKPKASFNLMFDFFKIFSGVELNLLTGNHDIQGHSSIKNTPLQMMEFLDGCENNDTAFTISVNTFVLRNRTATSYQMTMIHEFVSDDKALLKLIGGKHWKDVIEMVKENVEYNKHMKQIILCGDNHTPFVHEFENFLVINPGSMMRSTTTQKDFKPRFYILCYDTETEGFSVKLEYFKIEKDVFDIESAETKKESDKRIESFVEKLKNDQYEIGISFQKNIETYLKKNKIRKPVEKIIKEILDEC